MVDQQKLEHLLSQTGDMCLKRRAKLLVTELDPSSKDSILDVGCGDGFYLHLLSSLGRYKLTAIDNDVQAIKNAKKQVRNSSVHYVVGDIDTKMPFKSNMFSKIVCSEVLEHLPEDSKGIREMKRVLKKNGRLYITVPHWNFPFFWDPVNYILQRVFHAHVKTGFWSGVWAFHQRLYQVPELKKLLQKEGLKIDRFECLTHYGLPFNHYLTNIGFRLRTSSSLPQQVKNSMSKFHENDKKTLFTNVFDIINRLDRRNNRKFNENISTVGLFVVARKI